MNNYKVCEDCIKTNFNWLCLHMFTPNADTQWMEAVILWVVGLPRLKQKGGRRGKEKKV